MKIFVTGDTHKSIRRALRMYRAITSEKRRKGIPHVDSFDYLIHCGDYKEDALRLADKTGLPVICVYGNRDKAGRPDFDVLDTEAGSILVTHGHNEHVKRTHEELYALAEDQGCNCICFGHTHVPECAEENGLLLINPGSPTKPRKDADYSCAILTTDESGYNVKFVNYSVLPPSKKDLELMEKNKAAAEAGSTGSTVSKPSGKPEDKLKDNPDDKPSDNPDDKPKDDQNPAPPKKKTGVGGFLRKIFNYSDGQ